MADPEIEDNSGDMENDLHRLENHIEEAEKRLEARRKDADAVAGAGTEGPETDGARATDVEPGSATSDGAKDTSANAREQSRPSGRED